MHTVDDIINISLNETKLIESILCFFQYVLSVQ